MGPRTMKLVVFDFDMTLIEANSDTWIPEQARPAICARMFDMSPGAAARAAYEAHGWTHVCHECFKAMHEDGVTEAEMARLSRKLPACARLLAAVKAAAARDDVVVRVLSDANTVFIEEFLAAHGLGGLHVHTNPGGFDEAGRLHVAPADKTPSGCKRCPTNLCKGAVLDAWRAEREWHSVAYFGDGGGDVCPCLRLQAGDTACARAGYPLAKKLRKKQDALKCEVVEWATPEAEAEVLERLLAALPPTTGNEFTDWLGAQQAGGAGPGAGAFGGWYQNQKRVIAKADDRRPAKPEARAYPPYYPPAPPSVEPTMQELEAAHGQYVFPREPGEAVCLVSNNCYGGAWYKAQKREYNTPFIGCFLFAPCYLKLLENFHEIMSMPVVTGWSTDDSKYKKRVSFPYPILTLGGVAEVHFLHESGGVEAALGKWKRRKARMTSNLVFKMCDHGASKAKAGTGAFDALAQRFFALPEQWPKYLFVGGGRGHKYRALSGATKIVECGKEYPNEAPDGLKLERHLGMADSIDEARVGRR